MIIIYQTVIVTLNTYIANKRVHLGMGVVFSNALLPRTRSNNDDNIISVFFLGGIPLCCFENASPKFGKGEGA